MTSFFSRSVSLAILALAAFLPSPCFAQQADAFRNRIVADDSVVYLEWASLKDLKESGSPAEDWLAQDEIQVALKKLFKAIDGYQQANPMDDKFMEDLLIKTPELLQDCPITLHLTGYDEQYPDWIMGSTVIVVELGEHEQYAQKAIDQFVSEQKQNNSREFKLQKFDSGTIHHTAKTDEPKFGILAGNFVFAVGAIPIEEILANLKTPAPEIAKNFDEKLAVKRPFFNVYAKTDELIKQIDPIAMERFESFKFDEIEALTVSFGLDERGVVSSFLLECPEKPTGILSVLDTKSLSESNIADMPGGTLSSAGASLPLANIFEQFKLSAEISNGDEPLAESIESIENLTGLKFEEEILGSFEGTMFAYIKQVGGGSIVSLRVKDKAQFAERLTKIVKALREQAEEMQAEVLEKDYKGFTIYSFQPPALMGQSFSWCHADDELFVSSSSTSISSHLRRRGRERGRLIDDQRFKDSFELGAAKGWGKPIAFSHVDIATSLETAIPLGQAFLGQQSIEGFDFTFNDLPSIDVLCNGVEANSIVLFRTPEGIRGVESSTIPGLSSVGTTGIAVGMLLPAVQAVREAARRTTALNNGRQLQLAILNYESGNRRLPAPHSTDAAGKPLLSWRVHMLPFLEQQELYEKFRLNEPWDSEHNLKLLDQIPDVYQHPGSVTGLGKSNFLVVTGKNGAFPAGKGLEIGAMSDGTSNVVSLVCVNAQHAVNWTEPVDFDPADYDSLLEPLQGNNVGIDAMVFMVDGSAHALSDVDTTNLRQMMHRNDGKGKLKPVWQR